jgi:glucokinase
MAALREVRPIFLTGDIGGTNSRLKLFIYSDGKASAVKTFNKSYTSYDYPSLVPILQLFLSEAQAECDQGGPVLPSSTVLSVCGPTWKRGTCNDPSNVIEKVTGKRWGYQTTEGLEQALGLSPGSMLFCNDFEAIGHAIAALTDIRAPKDCNLQHITTLCCPKEETCEASPIGCLGAGTGLGAAFLTPDLAEDGVLHYNVFPSEAGMTYSFFPKTQDEWELLQHLGRKYDDTASEYPGKRGDVSPRMPFLEVERLVCGQALVDIAEFLAEADLRKGNTKEGAITAFLAALHETERDSPGDAPALVTSLASRGDPVCQRAVAWFLDFYGRTLSNTAMTFLCYSGLYIAGGILPKLASPENWRVLVSSFCDAGPRMSDVVSRVPLRLICDDDTGIKGCLYLAYKRQLRK